MPRAAASSEAKRARLARSGMSIHDMVALADAAAASGLYSPPSSSKEKKPYSPRPISEEKQKAHKLALDIFGEFLEESEEEGKPICCGGVPIKAATTDEWVKQGLCLPDCEALEGYLQFYLHSTEAPPVPYDRRQARIVGPDIPTRPSLNTYPSQTQLKDFFDDYCDALQRAVKVKITNPERTSGRKIVKELSYKYELVKCRHPQTDTPAK